MNKIKESNKSSQAFTDPSENLKLAKRKETKEKILSLVRSSTIHGYPKVFEDNAIFFKIMWCACFLTAVGSCGYLVSSSILTYLNNEVVTKFDVVYQVPLQFPTVTICYMNPFMTSASDSIILEKLSKFNMSLPNMTVDRYNLLNLKFGVATIVYSLLSDSEKKKLSYGLEETMIDCTFGMVRCSAADFEWYYEYLYGNCYKFNSGKDSAKNPIKLKNTIKAGNLYGLIVDLYLPESTSNFNFETINGLHIFIGNTSTIPYVMDGINAAPGFQTSIIVSRTVSSKVPYPYSKCKDDPDNLKTFDNYLYREVIKTKKIYKQTDCFDLCAQREMIKICKCHISYLGSLGSNTPCLTNEQLQCGFNIYVNFFADGLDEKCSECPVECESEIFSLSSSFSEFPTKHYADNILSSNKSILNEFKSKNYSADVVYDKLRKNLVSLNVYYGSLEYTQINQTKKTELIDLVSSIGGTMGLFIGISFLSFVEFIEIILYAIYRGLFE